MSKIIELPKNSRYSVAGVSGSVAGVAASLFAWHRHDQPTDALSVFLYALVPLALLLAAVLMPRFAARSSLFNYGVAALGFSAFLYGTFLLLLRQHVA